MRLDEVFDALAEFRLEYSLKSREAYLLTINEKHRYDPREVTIFKRLLQRELPEPVRTEIVRRLFAEHVTEDEAAFACELYMTEDQIACLARRGMHVGSHGYAHAWLNHLAPESQIIEVDRSLEFLQRFGISKDEWTICYPFGGVNDSLIQVLLGRKCRLGFTVEARTADLDVDGRLN